MQHERITRRTLLAGAAALTAGGSLSRTLPAFAQEEAAGRTNHALLVAVSDYPLLPPSAALAGPKNDAALVMEFLTSNAPVSFAQENLRVLADGVDGAGVPTKQNIRAALDDIAARAGNGDFVYLQFSGHGAQQPAMDPSLEPDGLDEIFLPADTGMWEDQTSGVPNALIDKEVRDHLQAIRDKGAFVWAVFDCCHSGTMTRAPVLGGGDETDRKIDFTALGIPETAMAAAAAQAQGGARGMGDGAARQNALGLEATAAASAQPAAPGGMVAFFAAQTTETTPEMLLPPGAEGAVKLGLFTYTLINKIAENPAITYRQLGQAILQAYSADNRTRPTPLFEGDLDRPVFGISAADRIAQWPIRNQGGGLEIPAGLLHRLSRGARLAVLPTPGSTLDDAVGYVEVQTAKNLSSRIVPVAHEGLPALEAADIAPGAYARLTELQVGLELVVARPAASDLLAEETGLLNAALDEIVKEERTPVNLRLVEAGEAADLKLAVMSEMDVAAVISEQTGEAEASRASLDAAPRAWLLQPSAELSLNQGRRPPSVPLQGVSGQDIAGALSANLVSIFRATSLARLTAASDYRPEEFSVGFKVLRAETGDTDLLQPGAVPIVHPQDQVHVEARNASSKPVDINVLYIGSDYSITHIYAERLHGGSEIDLPLLAFTEDSFGVERMVVVLSEAAPLSAVEDLAFLEQVGVRQATRAAGVASGGFGDLLRDVANAPATRGAARIGEKASGAKGAVMIFPMETMPRG